MKNIINFTFITILSCFLYSCTTNDESTIVLLGEELYIKEINEIIPDSTLNIIESNIGTIHKGYIPPNIEGNYVINKKQRVFSNIGTNSWPIDVIEPDVKINIYQQHNRTCVIEIDELSSITTDTAYICGENDFFTLYLTENKVLFYSGFYTYITRNIIFTGEISEKGIKNIYMSSIITDAKDNSNGNIIQYNKGDLFIYKDSDNISERIQ